MLDPDVVPALAFHVVDGHRLTTHYRVVPRLTTPRSDTARIRSQVELGAERTA
ncbi:hypothetical protein [Pseudonocardia sp. N23]|uniref:hypothetical protein n=1 Tax=Pseudonocardia sp. N23 TaxID=1987376 RepID=UPI000C029BEB|nr:hypothetical protein [Pseudonocardia sp. N23]GAY13095.1 3',5'-cyclic-nucleotide phosphodiesterase [Pseudonocardia sp. N23]